MDISYFLYLSCVGLFTIAQAQDCSKPDPGENMDLKGSDLLLASFPHGTTVKFQCNPGYRPVSGSISITCTSGIWSPVALTCERKYCGHAGSVLNGDIEYPNGSQFGDYAVVVCKTGHRLVGRSERRCGVDGWEGNLPRCEVVTCDPPPEVENGSYDPVKEVYKYRESIEYTCKTDFDLVGQSSTSCSAEGHFHHKPPQCKKVECPHHKVAHGEWIDGAPPPHKYHYSMTFKCDPGYVMKGQATIRCGSENLWIPEPPLCNVLTCPPPSQVKHGSFSPDKPSYEYKSEVKYSCDAGYKLSGSTSQSCSDGGTFTPTAPTCIKSRGHVVEIVIGVLLGTGAVVGAILGFIFLRKKKKSTHRSADTTVL